MSSNPQWKMFQPPDSHPSPLQDILDLQHSNMQAKQAYRNEGYEYSNSPRDYNNMNNTSGSRFGGYNMDSCPMGDAGGVFSSSSTNNSSSQPQYDAANHPPIRETGIIEKLLHSYGFIQCCERQARLFFHFSQFSGNIEHLKIGDPVEFEMTYDRRTGKPIASNVTKIAPEVVLSEARVTGTVTTEVKGEGAGDSTGRISYENRGECFFLPYTKDDVEGNVILHIGDAVSFQIATNQRGTLGAAHIRFENPAHPVKYHGVVCSLKENFGFIERADVVKEIFFHYSEAKTKQPLALGDDVEFNIQTRNGKEVAANITKLPPGSVVFEDVSPEIMRGQVLKPVERGNMVRLQNDPLPGRIRYRAPDHSEVEVPFGDKDQSNEFTLRHGDWVQFQVATDRRDQLKRATNISLLEESFNVSGEKREQGVISSLRDGFGFIRCVEREPSLLFHFSEMLHREIVSVGEEVEFTVEPLSTFTDKNTRQCAIRIKLMPAGTVKFETLVEQGARGTVAKEPSSSPGASSLASPPSEEPAEGMISCLINGMKKMLSFTPKDCDSQGTPRIGDKVIFDIYQVRRNKNLIAKSVQVQPNLANGVTNSNTNGSSNARPMMQGFIVAIKDGYGFIETADHTKEVFFHFSNLDGRAEGLEPGTEVEFTIGRSNGAGGGCASAEYVRILPPGTIPIPKPLKSTLHGTVTRAMRSVNPDQNEYSGIIVAEGSRQQYEYGIMSLNCKREILQLSDPVMFQVDEEGRATNIVPLRKKLRGVVESIKNGFGFLSVIGEETRRLFFHMSEVRGNTTDLQQGDAVEFVELNNPRNGKSSACNVVKIARPPQAARARPEHLARLRGSSIEDPTVPRVVAIRTPRGPDAATRGFKPRRPISELITEMMNGTGNVTPRPEHSTRRVAM